MATHDDRTDEGLDGRIRQLAGEHNAPPPTPRDEMWRVISARRAASVAPGRRARWTPWAAAAAALLAVGIGIGRLSAPAAGPATPEGAAETRRVNPTAYRLATQEHLAQSAAFLTLFRASLERPDERRIASAAARQLLAGNRLLLDSPAARDAPTRRLLEDLELVLAQIAQLSPGSPGEDLKLIREGIERGDVIPRLRSAVPGAPAPTQGAL